MRTALVILTVVEIAAFLGALVAYLVRINRSLRVTSRNLGKVAFGVRAIDTQTGLIGPSVRRINEQLRAIAAALDALAERTGSSRS